MTQTMVKPGIGAQLRRGGWTTAAGVALTGAALAAAALLDGYYGFVLGQVLILAFAASGLNLLVGAARQVSFGHAGFFAIGAYATAIATTAWGLDFWLAWLLSGGLACLIGAALSVPALRVRGPYLAMVTISFGFIIEYAIIEGGAVTGGHSGLLGVSSPRLAGVDIGQRGVVLLAAACAILSVAAMAMAARARWGLRLRAVADSEAAAEAVGINPTPLRCAAFAISALTAGLAGGLYVVLAGFVTPVVAGMDQSITLVLAVMIGGSGNPIGPALGALAVGVAPEFMGGLGAYRPLAFGVALLAVLLAAPEGLGALFRRAGTSRALPEGPVRSLKDLLGARGQTTLTGESLAIVFGGVRAVADVSIAVEGGRVTALIGPNGAGKSSLLNLLSGFYRPDGGRLRLGGAPLIAGNAWRIARAGVARTFQHSQLFDSLTIEDNVALAARRFDRSRAVALLRAVGFEGEPGRLAGAATPMDRRLVELARALAADPKVLLLDEPAAGLARGDKRRLGEVLRAIADCGIAVGLVEHDMDLVMSVSDHIVVLCEGAVLAEGAPAEVAADPRVRAAYLGEAVASPRPRQTAPRDEAAPVLEVRGLACGYGGAPVLKELDLRVGQGEAVALFGANGAGKTTLMRALAGLHPVLAGEAVFLGSSILGLDAAAIVRRGMALVPEGRGLFPELTARENLRMGALIRGGTWKAGLEEVLDYFPALAPRLSTRAGLLSGGEQQMLAIGRAMLSRPRLLLLDEPSIGLAPRVVRDLFDQLDRLRLDRGMSILIVDQMADLCLEFVDRAYVVRAGSVVGEGDVASIRQSGVLDDGYLSKID